jgi:hypothetical protein
MDDRKFKIKAFGFGELARMYLPDASQLSTWVYDQVSDSDLNLWRVCMVMAFSKINRFLTKPLVQDSGSITLRVKYILD